MERPIGLETLAARVMIPPVMWDDICLGTHEAETLIGKNLKQYADELSDIAFSKSRDYSGFRRFIQEHAVLYKKDSVLLENITTTEIDYVLDRVREERVEVMIEGLKLDNL